MGLNRFIEKAKEIHGDKYNYDNSIYEKIHLNIEIRCSEHGYFFQSASNHLRGQGCPKCGKIKSKKKS
jgi:rubrerythrin